MKHLSGCAAGSKSYTGEHCGSEDPAPLRAEPPHGKAGLRSLLVDIGPEDFICESFTVSPTPSKLHFQFFHSFKASLGHY